MSADNPTFRNEDKNQIFRNFTDAVDTLAETADGGDPALRTPEAVALFERGQMAITLMSDEIARAIMEVHNSTEHDPQLPETARAYAFKYTHKHIR